MIHAGVVDVHTHALPAGFVERVREEGARFGYRLDGSRLLTPDGLAVDVGGQRTEEILRQRDMAAAGIDLRLQSVLPGIMSYGAGESEAAWGTRTLNDSHGEVMRAFPDLVSALATVPLQFPMMSVRELERVTAEYGMVGVQIATNVNGENLDRPEFIPFWDAAQSMGLLVFIHPRYQVGQYRMSRYSLSNLIGNPLETTIAAASLIFGGVLERYPRLKIVLAHSGGFVPWIRGRWRHGHEVRSSLKAGGATRAFDDYLRLLYFDTLIHDEGDALALRFLIDTVGSDHVLLGTDYPADMGDWTQVPFIRSLEGITDEAKDQILGGNALRLIRPA